ncbi:MAG: DUF835 domain-containing protein [Thermoplasmata archaeon]
MLEGIAGGTTYIVKERRGQAAFQLFTRLISPDHPGLCITRKHPQVASGQWSIPESVEFKWLTPSVGRDRVDPKSLNLLTRIIYEFVVEHEQGIVLLDGLEYILFHNEFSKTLLFMEHLNDLIMQSRAVLLAPISPEALKGHDIALLERNTEVLEGDALTSQARVEKFVRLIDDYLKR